ncbi:hypothetical protein FKP32DRAFT_99476 [Trametes sanguinea]|nr:hypothetical protein FKP32DRAFT_99476 [Trametes sanguinea]
MPGASDLCTSAINFGFALQMPEPTGDMVYPYSPNGEQNAHDQFSDMHPVSTSASHNHPHGLIMPSLLEEHAGPSSLPIPHYAPSVASPSFTLETQPALPSAEPSLPFPSEAAAHTIAPPASQPATLRRSTRKRQPPPTPAATQAPPAPTAKPIKRRKTTPTPAQPVASGSNVQLEPAVVTKERERATRRTREEVLAQMAPLQPVDCPQEGCEKKFGIAREVDVEHLKEYYPGVAFTGAKVKCFWADCEVMWPYNALVDHIYGKHLKARFRCFLHKDFDPKNTCIWTSSRSGDVNGHMQRKHGRLTSERRS